MGNLGSKPALVALTSGDLGADIVTAAKIADDVLNSEHYAAGSIDEEHVADNAITLAKMASGTDGNIISFDASGNPVAIATGSDGQVLTSGGAGAPPAFEAAAAGGKVKQMVYNMVQTVSSGTGSFPYDATIPQIGEGRLILTQAITPTASDTLLKIEVIVQGSISNHAQYIIALFQDSTADALAVSRIRADAQVAVHLNNNNMMHVMVSGTTSETSFTIRMGAYSGTSYLNEATNNTGAYGGRCNSGIVITEIETGT
tara:strand:- start:2876 stop:3649 length:774 start_codon:yes stop_codon:yes gene_type:complete